MRRNCIQHIRRSGQLFQYRKKSDICSFFVTTPIFYVNASPHIGHLYSAVLADASQRFQKILQGGETFLSSGTDEHGSKVQAAAKSSNVQSYCDQISSQFQEMLELYDVGYGEFVRTTSTNHKAAVYKFWDKLNSRGYIYQGEYAGWYCEADEAFVPETLVVQSSSPKYPGKVSSESGRPVQWTTEKNYIFQLSSCKDELLHWLSNGKVVQPAKFHKLLVSWANEGLNDVSITRPASRVPWGIAVPNNPGHTMYVWFDALINYLTAAGFPNRELKRWPPDLHVIGKDILRFHGLLWPALLIAAGFEPPKQLLCHSHWLVDGEKMSKSIGNVVNPCSEQAKKFTTCGLRYFLIREGVAHSDGNYSETKAKNILNAELADKLGNLLNRCTGLSLNPKQIWPAINNEHEKLISGAAAPLIRATHDLPDISQQHFEKHNFYKVVDSVMAVLQEANKFFESQKPWTLVRNGQELAGILCLTMETLRVCGIVLQPIVPKISTQLLDKLGVDKDQRLWQNLQTFIWNNLPTEEKCLNQEKIALFPRLVFK